MRGRRRAWRVTAVCAGASLVLVIVFAILLSPLLYALAGLGLDLINRVWPTPDLLGGMGALIGPLIDSLDAAKPASLERWLRALAIAAAPGMVVVTLMALVLRRALMLSPLFHPDSVQGRAALASDLAEQRFAHTVEEMAIAAQIPAPRVVFVGEGANAAAFGPHEGQAVVMAGNGLLPALTRQQMQAVAGHLIASIADGDMRIGMRTAVTLGLFALPSALTAGWSERARVSATLRLVQALAMPTASNLDLILRELGDPFREPDASERAAAAQSTANPRLTWGGNGR